MCNFTIQLHELFVICMIINDYKPSQIGTVCCYQDKRWQREVRSLKSYQCRLRRTLGEKSIPPTLSSKNHSCNKLTWTARPPKSEARHWESGFFTRDAVSCLRNGIFPAESVNKDVTSLWFQASKHKFLSPRGTQKGEQCLRSSSCRLPPLPAVSEDLGWEK